MKNTQQFSTQIPFTKTEPVNGQPVTTKYFDLIISGTATKISEQDFDGSWDHEYDFEIEEVKYQEPGKEVLELPSHFLWFGDFDVTDMDTHSNHHSLWRIQSDLPPHKKVKEYIQDHIESLSYNEEHV